MTYVEKLEMYMLMLIMTSYVNFNFSPDKYDFSMYFITILMTFCLIMTWVHNLVIIWLLIW